MAFSGLPVSGLVFVKYCPLPALQVFGVFVLQLASLSSSSVPIVLQLILRMLNNSMSGMPNNACLYPGTTKKLHILCLLLCSNFTLHMPSFVNVVWLCIFSLMFVFLVATNCSIVALENNLLYMYNGIIFPSLSVSTLYQTVIATLLMFLDLLLSQNDWN